MGDVQPPSNKKAKSSKYTTSTSSVRSNSNTNNDCTSNYTDSEIKTQGIDQWNLTNFNLLTDCVSSFADQESALIDNNDNTITTTYIPVPTNIASSNSKSNEERYKDSCNIENIVLGGGGGVVNTNTLMYSSYKPIVSNSSIQASESIQSASVVGANTTTTHVQNSQVPYFNEETEFVCIIRTSDAYFAQYSSQSDLYMFSSSTQLLSTASMEAHDLKPGNNRLHQLIHHNNNQYQLTGFCNNLDMKHHQRAGSSHSSGSGTNLPNSSSDTNKNSTSSETGSDDNCNGSDENSS